MGIIKGIGKVLGTTVLGATGVASTVLKGMFDTVGVELGSEIFGAAKDASFNGIRNMWDVEPAQEEVYVTEEEAETSANAKEKHNLKVQALRCKDMAQRATTEEMRKKFMDRYEELMDQANSM